MKKRYLFIAAVLLLTCACTEKETVISDSVPESVQFKVHSLTIVEEDASTRVALVHEGNVQRFRWEATDTVGVFPNAGSQVWFSMSSGVGTNTATFDGGAWSLRESSTYYSYYPFVGDMYLASDRVPVCFSGQRQSGMAFSNGVMYMGATGTTNAQGGLVFDYDHLNAVLWFDLTIPAGTYTKATLSTSEPVLVKEGHFDLSNPLIVADRYTRSLDVTLENFTVQGGSSVPVYLSIAPADLTTKTLKLEVLGADGRRHTCQWVPSVAYEASHCYHLVRTLTSAAPTQTNRTNVWREENNQVLTNYIPDYDSNQNIPGLQWYPNPTSPNGTVAVLIGGEDFNSPAEKAMLDEWASALTARGVQCIALDYRTPRSRTREYYRSAWQDAQRAIRVIRNAAGVLGYDANRIGVVGFSAGANVALRLALRPAEMAYTATDAYEQVNNGAGVACNVNWAILQSTAYVTVDSDGILPPASFGTATYPQNAFLYPSLYTNTIPPPTCFIHGQDDPYTARAATQMYRWMRIWGAHSEVHLYPGVGHESVGLERGIEFLKQMGFLDPLAAAEVATLSRYPNDNARAQYIREDVWPSGRIPDWDATQTVPYIEWHFPRNRKTDAIQIIYSGGSYKNSATDTPDVMGTRRYLNEKGITVVTLRYRYKYVNGVYDRALNPKHLAAWQDLQRTVRLVRSKAAQYGLDPDRIGIMGASAGGHLTVMGATSSQRKSYKRVDAIDDLSCKVQWAIACCPAYLLSDGMDDYANTSGGNADSAALVQEFSFDSDTPPMMFIHGNADPYAAMGSVKAWERLSSMGIPAEVHTLATRPHSFQMSGYPGTGGYTWLDRVGDFVERWW